VFALSKDANDDVLWFFWLGDSELDKKSGASRFEEFESREMNRAHPQRTPAHHPISMAAVRMCRQAPRPFSNSAIFKISPKGDASPHKYQGHKKTLEPACRFVQLSNAHSNGAQGWMGVISKARPDRKTSQVQGAMRGIERRKELLMRQTNWQQCSSQSPSE
jgi:hypothetical protein